MAGRIEYDEAGRMVIIHEASLTATKAVAEVCQRLQIEGYTGDKEMPHLAEYPPIIVQTYCDVNGITWDEWVQNPEHTKRMLRDPALAHFRINPGKV